MGTKMAPSYANILMDSLERQFLESEPFQPALWKRYIDDILCVWPGSRESLEAFLRRLTSCHPTIHFTRTISMKSVDFLDIRIYKGSRFRETGILDVQTNFKPTSTFQYLHFSSSHSKGVFKGLVRDEAIWFLRSNSSQDDYEKTISIFRRHLLCRGYLPQLCFRREKAVSNYLVSAKALGRSPPPTADVPLQITTTAKRVQPCI